MKKKISLLLVLCMLMTSLVACSSTSDEEVVVDIPSAEDVVIADGVTTQIVGRDWDSLAYLFEADTVVMTVDGSDVTWEEFFYWLYASVSDMEYYLGYTADFNEAALFDSTQSYGEYLVGSAESSIIQYHALNVNAALLGMDDSILSDEDFDLMVESDMIATLGDTSTVEEFYEYLATMYVSETLYEHIIRTGLTYTELFTFLYGESGELTSDDVVEAYIEDSGYMGAMHILFATTDDTGAALPDEQKSELLAKAQLVSDALQAETDVDAMLELFNTYSAEYNDDTGMLYYTEGYVFASGEMVTEFEEGTAALGDYEVSEPIESVYGYHVIVRVPIDGDSVVQEYTDFTVTIKYMAAIAAYDEQFYSWIENAELIWSEDFIDMDFSTLLNSTAIIEDIVVEDEVVEDEVIEDVEVTE